MEIQELEWRWYVLHTRSRFEKVVNEGLFKKSHEVFLPQIRVRSRRRDRRVMLDVPLFPGYVFIRSNLHPDHHLDILKTVGAVRLIGNQNLPVPVPDDTIESLRIMVCGLTGIVSEVHPPTRLNAAPTRHSLPGKKRAILRRSTQAPERYHVSGLLIGRNSFPESAHHVQIDHQAACGQVPNAKV